MAISLRQICAIHNGLSGNISIVKDFFRYKYNRFPDSTWNTSTFSKKDSLPGKISVLDQVKLLQGGEVVHLHLKIVFDLWIIIREGIEKGRPSIDEMIFNMRRVYGRHGIGVVVQSIERLDLPPNFYDIDVDSDECDILFEKKRNFVSENHVVIYLVRNVFNDEDAKNGFRPSGEDGALVAWIASPLTIAHEVGHALDLNHPDEDCSIEEGECFITRLMTDSGTWRVWKEWTKVGTFPILTDDEVEDMKDSDLTMEN
jgi:hypothetical protein